VLRARVDAGGTSPLERDLVEVELRRLEAERLLAAGRADVAMVRLKQLLGMSPEAPLLLRETLETLVAASTAPAADAWSIAIAARPDVRESEARVTLADARIDRARHEGRFDVSLFGSYMRMDAGFAQQGFGPTGKLERVRGRFNYVSGGAMVTVPWFNRNQGQVIAAQAERSGSGGAPRRDRVDPHARRWRPPRRAMRRHGGPWPSTPAGCERSRGRTSRSSNRRSISAGQRCLTS
jgi:outer membrane protein TolC